MNYVMSHWLSMAGAMSPLMFKIMIKFKLMFMTEAMGFWMSMTKAMLLWGPMALVMLMFMIFMKPVMP
ncbi:hypothetical protein NL501_30380, partial [Klebsiella pneumoniae]|nr:hypothetical protein [Klebsiella pneumoniae]